jgi:hypothetical protein
MVLIRERGIGQAGPHARTPAAGENRRRRGRRRWAEARHHLLRHADQHRGGVHQGQCPIRSVC